MTSIPCDEYHQMSMMYREDITALEQVVYEINVLLNLYTAIEAHGMSDALSNFVDSEGTLTAICGSAFNELSAEVACESILITIKDAFIKFIKMIKDFFVKVYRFIFRITEESEEVTERIEELVETVPEPESVYAIPIKAKVPTPAVAQLYGDLATSAGRAYGEVFEHFRDSTPITFNKKPIKNLYNSCKGKLKCKLTKHQKKKNIYFFEIPPPVMEGDRTLVRSGWTIIADIEKYKSKELKSLRQLRKLEDRSKIFVNVMEATKKRLDDMEPAAAKTIVSDMQACITHYNKLIAPSIKIASAIKTMKEEVEGLLLKQKATEDK